MEEKYNQEVKGGDEQMVVEKIIPKTYVCERCGHEWFPRAPELPKVCPKCNSPYWDKPRKNQEPSNNKENGKE